MRKVIQHHTKYKEIHGYDEIKLMTQVEHKLLHNRLRRAGNCNISFAELRRISKLANIRSPKGKAVLKRYRQSPKGKKHINQYRKQHIRKLDFYETLGKNIRLHEVITYNSSTYKVTYTAVFRGENGFRLPVIEV